MKRQVLWYGLGLVLFPVVAWCDPIYKWVDDAGVIHYAQQPPSTAENVEMLGLESSAVGVSERDAQQDLQELVARVRAMENARRESELKQREERVLALQEAYYRRQLQEQQEAQSEPEETSDNVILATPYYGYYPGYGYPRYWPNRYSNDWGLQIFIGNFPQRDHQWRHPPQPDHDGRRPVRSDRLDSGGDVRSGASPRPAGLTGTLASE